MGRAITISKRSILGAFRLLLVLALTFRIAFAYIHNRYDEPADVQVADGQGFSIPPVEAFIARWLKSGGSELRASQAVIIDLCDLIEVPRPTTPRPEVANNDYTFEAQINFVKTDGSKSTGRIDFYKKKFFIRESEGSPQINKAEHTKGRRKGTAVRDTDSWDNAMI